MPEARNTPIPYITFYKENGTRVVIKNHESIDLIHGLNPDLEATYNAIREIQELPEEDQSETALIELQLGLAAILYGPKDPLTKKLIHDYIEVPIASRVHADLLAMRITSMGFFNN
ncbi:hypothetical protein KBD69_01275 [Candidatus Woesebacteria bacterium]|nr:hypothetical protein [Candidatus Woesebacteria bacterium]